MKCTNCGANVPHNAAVCPECGVFARVIEPEHRPRRSRPLLLLVVLLAAIAAGAAAYFYFSATQKAAAPKKPAPIRVVHDRPGGARVGAGAKINEAEAILRLRRSLNLPEKCVGILSHGYRDGAYDLSAVNSCEGTRLGHWRVDGKSGAVTRP